MQMKREKSHQFVIFFFINQETIFFTNKTIPKLVNESGNVITDQNQILQEAKTYHENLYSKRDTVNNINLKNEIPYGENPLL
jgi:flavorubredoxin